MHCAGEMMHVVVCKMHDYAPSIHRIHPSTGRIDRIDHGIHRIDRIHPSHPSTLIITIQLGVLQHERPGA
jgi:hypothetical protein